MGEAKRRKQLDPTFGIVSRTNSKVKKIKLGFIARQAYARYGIGLCATSKKCPFSYVQSENLINDLDKVWLNRYDPSREFVLTYLIDGSDFWVTSIVSYCSKKAETELILPKHMSLETLLDKCLL